MVSSPDDANISDLGYIYHQIWVKYPPMMLMTPWG
jgi:hypothetical protein